MAQIILACDDNGRFLEYIPKELGHTGEGRRHLGITVLLYNSKGEVLLQRRKHKVFDNIWDFTASTHTLHKDSRDETLEEAALRCLEVEWGLPVGRQGLEIKRVGEFNYFVKVGELCENEHDNVMIAEYNGEVNLNPEAGYEYKWVEKVEVLKDMEGNPKKYSAWAKGSLKVLKEKGFFP